MAIAHIQQALDGVIALYSERPEAALSADKPATAVLEAGLRCRAVGPNGAVLLSDMPRGIGGGATAPTPSWLMRAALANCDATMIALRAAQCGVVLSRLEVTVESRSDDRGMFGIDGADVPGPLTMRVQVRIAAEGAAPEQLREIVAWAEAHSPVGDALRRAVPSTTDVIVDE